MWFEPERVELVRDAGPEWLAYCYAVLSYLGSVWVVVPTVVLAYWSLDRRRFGPWLGIVAGCYAFMHALKGLFETPRPGVGPTIAPESLPPALTVLYTPVVEVQSTSFPSGHVIAAVVLWAMVALEFGEGEGTGRGGGLPARWQPGRIRLRRLLGAAVIVTLVGVGRIGVGVHFPLDVLAGAVAGVAYLLPMLAIADRARARGDAAATEATFAVSAVLAVFALVIDPYPNPAALLGGCLGAVLAWRCAPPSRHPQSVSARGAGAAVVGIASGVLAVAAGVVVETLAVWVLAGLVGGVVVVGLPRFAEGSNR